MWEGKRDSRWFQGLTWATERMELPFMELNRGVGLHAFFCVEFSAPYRGSSSLLGITTDRCRAEEKGTNICWGFNIYQSLCLVLYYTLSHFFSTKKPTNLYFLLKKLGVGGKANWDQVGWRNAPQVHQVESSRATPNLGSLFGSQAYMYVYPIFERSPWDRKLKRCWGRQRGQEVKRSLGKMGESLKETKKFFKTSSSQVQYLDWGTFFAQLCISVFCAFIATAHPSRSLPQIIERHPRMEVPAMERGNFATKAPLTLHL